MVKNKKQKTKTSNLRHKYLKFETSGRSGGGHFEGLNEVTWILRQFGEHFELRLDDAETREIMQLRNNQQDW